MFPTVTVLPVVAIDTDWIAGRLETDTVPDTAWVAGKLPTLTEPETGWVVWKKVPVTGKVVFPTVTVLAVVAILTGCVA